VIDELRSLTTRKQKDLRRKSRTEQKDPKRNDLQKILSHVITPFGFSSPSARSHHHHAAQRPKPPKSSFSNSEETGRRTRGGWRKMVMAVFLHVGCRLGEALAFGGSVSFP